MAKKILLVDDDLDLVGNYRAVFAKEGYEVACAHTAADGLKAALDFRPDLIVLDVSMETDTAGFEFVYQIRSRRESSRYKAVSGTPIVLLTAIHHVTNSRFSLNDSQSFLPGVEEMLSKPVRNEALLDKVKGLLG